MPDCSSTEVTFDGAHVKVREALIDGPTCFVTFSSVGTKHKTGFGEAFLRKHGYSAIHLVSTWDHWYQVDEVRAAIDLVQAKLQAQKFSKIITYGASMGGYGAAAHSAVLKAQKAILIAPQFSIDGRKVSFEKRWRNEAAKLSFNYDDMTTQLGKSTQKYFIYDPHSEDQKHINLYAQFPGCEFLSVPYCGHVPGHAILHAGLLQRLITDIAGDTFDQNLFYRDFHLGRRKSPAYWSGLANFALKRRPMVALYAIKRSIEIEPKNLSHALLNFNILIRLGHFADALDRAQDLVTTEPSHPACWRALAVAAMRCGDLNEAVEAARTAVTLRPYDADLQRVLAETLFRARRYLEACTEGSKAIDMDPSFNATYLQTAEAYFLSSNPEKGLEVLAKADSHFPGNDHIRNRGRELRIRFATADANGKPS
jgi:predicted Zn-dependent protease